MATCSQYQNIAEITIPGRDISSDVFAIADNYKVYRYNISK